MTSIFLSHSSIDKPFVRLLADRFTQEGVLVWLDEAVLNIGDSLIEKISEGIYEMDFVAAVISSNSTTSSWVQRELSLAMTKEIKGKRVVVLPILIDKCQLPAFLIDKLYADFTRSENFEGEFLRLLRAMGIQVPTERQLRAEDYFEQAFLKHIAGDYAEAMVYYSEAIRFNPQYYDAYFNRSIARAIHRDINGAMEDINEAIRINPNDPMGYDKRFTIRQMAEFFHKIAYTEEEKLADLNEAFRLDPQNPVRYMDRANRRKEAGDINGAMEDINEAIRLNSELADAYTLRAGLYIERKNFEAAIGDCDEAIRLDRRAVLAHTHRMEARKQIGDIKGAESDRYKLVYFAEGASWLISPPDAGLKKPKKDKR